VSAGDVLAVLDTTALDIQISSAESALEQARVAAENSAANLARQEELLSRGVVTTVAVDTARTESVTATQALVQAQRALETAQNNAGNATLEAPFDGIISSVDTQSFATVGSGSPIVTLYVSETFEVSFTVNFETINQLAVGKPAVLRLADSPDRTLQGVVTELGANADTVASFPVIVTVTDAPQDIKSGMAVEVNLEFDLPTDEGFTIPMTAFVIEGDFPETTAPSTPTTLQLYVYDSTSQTVQLRDVLIGGVRENSILVISGLTAGEHVASAGVSFLTDGQSVTLLED